MDLLPGDSEARPVGWPCSPATPDRYRVRRLWKSWLWNRRWWRLCPAAICRSSCSTRSAFRERRKADFAPGDNTSLMITFCHCHWHWHVCRIDSLNRPMSVSILLIVNVFYWRGSSFNTVILLLINRLCRSFIKYCLLWPLKRIQTDITKLIIKKSFSLLFYWL